MATTRDLFGGAIRAEIPNTFDDISNFRQVPDHQEVFVNPLTEQSIIFDILDRVEGSDQESSHVHFKELVTCNEAANCQIISEEVLKSGDLPHFNPSIAKLLVVGTMQVAKFNETSFNTIQMFMCLIRLQNVQTDLLVTLNNAIRLDPDSSSVQHAALVGTSNPLTILKATLKSLQIVDWSLFGNN